PDQAALRSLRPATGPRATHAAARRGPLHAWHPRRDVPRPPVDDAAVRGLRHGATDQPTLPLPARAGPDRPFRGLRPTDPDGPRLRPSARARRGGARRRGDLVLGGHGGAALRAPA